MAGGNAPASRRHVYNIGQSGPSDAALGIVPMVTNHAKHVRSNRDDDSRRTTAANNNYSSLRSLDLLKAFESAAFGLLCNTSCKGNCGSPSAQSGSQCYCDEACEHIGDCCLDYEAACLHGPKVTSDNYVEIVRGRNTLPLECFAFQDANFHEYNITIVSVCGQKASSKHISHSHMLCECSSVKNRNLSTELPVMFRGVIYRNKYCAICNNPGADVASAAESNVTFYCGRNSSVAYEIWQHTGVGAFISYAIDSCRLLVNAPDNLKNDLTRYSCRRGHSPSGWCDARESNMTFDSEYMAAMCRSYRADIGYRVKGVRYKNPHCAMCKDATWSEFPVCLSGSTQVDSPIPVIRHLPYFNLLLDITEETSLVYDGKVLCPTDTLHDYTRDVCVTPTCPPGHVSMDNKTYCVKLNARVEQIFTRRKRSTVSIVITLQTSANIGVHELEHVSLALHDVWCKVAGSVVHDVWNNVDCLALHKHSLKRLDVRKWNGGNTTCFVHRIPNVHLQQVISRVQSFRHEMFHVFGRSNVTTIKDIVVLNHDINATFTKCSGGTVRIRKRLVFVGYHFPDDDGFPSTFFVVNTSQTYNVTEVPIAIAWHVDTPDSWTESSSSVVCEPKLLTCETVMLDEGLFLDLGRSIILFHGLSVEKNVSERDVLRLTSKAIVVCVSSLQRKTGWRRKSNATGIGVLTILARTANIVSMSCLVFTALTYSLFPSLRKGPGTSVVNLTSALFLAQLSFHVHASFLPYRAACTVVAVFQHYVWLVAFLWMNVLGYDISCNFTKLNPSADPAHSTRLRYYLVYAWASPAIFVTACLGIDHATEKSFFYGQDTRCRLGGGTFYLYYFVTPASLVISANIIFFFRTIVALRSATSIGNLARNTRQQRNTFVVYVRLTSLMGVTWLLYFLGSIEALEFLTFTFALCNLTQGIFICFSFSLTPTVRQLWRSRFFISCESNSDNDSVQRMTDSCNPSTRSSVETTRL